jgi:hypothetical protein
MARNPDLETTARELPVAMAGLGRTVQYMPEPTAVEASYRHDAGTCAVCDVSAKGCWCRFCPTCDRVWLAMKSAERDDERPHHGIKEEECPECAADAPAGSSS